MGIWCSRLGQGTSKPFQSRWEDRWSQTQKEKGGNLYWIFINALEIVSGVDCCPRWLTFMSHWGSIWFGFANAHRNTYSEISCPCCHCLECCFLDALLDLPCFRLKGRVIKKQMKQLKKRRIWLVRRKMKQQQMTNQKTRNQSKVSFHYLMVLH